MQINSLTGKYDMTKAPTTTYHGACNLPQVLPQYNIGPIEWIQKSKVTHWLDDGNRIAWRSAGFVVRVMCLSPGRSISIIIFTKSPFLLRPVACAHVEIKEK